MAQVFQGFRRDGFLSVGSHNIRTCSSSTREEIRAVLDALDADVERACELTFDALTTPERLRILVRLEKVARRLPVPGHELINQLTGQATRDELGGKLRDALADRLHITPGEANRRIAEAADLGPRRALTGEPMPPQLTGTAAAQHDGTIGAGHVHVIRRFLDHLPCSVDIGTREKAEAHLAELAPEHRPDDPGAIGAVPEPYRHRTGNARMRCLAGDMARIS